MRVGLLVNPIAGMGGPVGLKGTASADEARKLGATPVAPDRCRAFLDALGPAVTRFDWVAAGGAMGQDYLAERGATATVAHAPGGTSTAQDTRDAAAAMAPQVDALVVVGGDGTLWDVVSAVGDRVAILGVPAGVKMHSGHFALTPPAAAAVLLSPWTAVPRDVLDADEEALVRGEFRLAHRGVALALDHELVACAKCASDGSVEDAVEGALEWIAKTGPPVVLGPGTTLLALKRRLMGRGTPAGVDVWLGGGDGRLDVDARTLETVTAGSRPHVVLSPIGGQGAVLGRGNQPITRAVLERAGWERILVIATVQKLRATPTLFADVDGLAVPPYVRVLTGVGRWRIVRTAAAGLA